MCYSLDPQPSTTLSIFTQPNAEASQKSLWIATTENVLMFQCSNALLVNRVNRVNVWNIAKSRRLILAHFNPHNQKMALVSLKWPKLCVNFFGHIFTIKKLEKLRQTVRKVWRGHRRGWFVVHLCTYNGALQNKCVICVWFVVTVWIITRKKLKILSSSGALFMVKLDF